MRGVIPPLFIMTSDFTERKQTTEKRELLLKFTVFGRWRYCYRIFTSYMKLLVVYHEISIEGWTCITCVYRRSARNIFGPRKDEVSVLSIYNGYQGLFSRGKSGWSVKLTTHLHLVLRSTMRAAVPRHLQYVLVVWFVILGTFRLDGVILG
jgi:hypothetical protein